MASNNNQGDDSNLLDLFVKQVLPILGAVGGAAAILFATGFFITNISLLTFGVYETGLLRERHVSAGIAYILILAILFVVALGVFKAIGIVSSWIEKIVPKYYHVHDRKLTKLPLWGVACVLGLISLIIILALLTFVFFGFRDSVLGEIWQVGANSPSIIREHNDIFKSMGVLHDNFTVRFIVWSFVVVFVATFFWWWSFRSYRRKEETSGNGEGFTGVIKQFFDIESRKETSGNGEGVTGVIKQFFDFESNQIVFGGFVIFLFAATYFYGRNVYAAVPAALGGGLPVIVQFSAVSEKMPEFVELGIQPESTVSEGQLETSDTNPQEEGGVTSLTRKVNLVAKTDSHYIVLVHDPDLKQDVAISFPKEFADSIIYFPEEYFLNDEYVANKRTEDGQAILAKENPDFDSAEDAFKDALRRKSDYFPALIGLGDTYVMWAQSEPGKNKKEELICKAIKNYRKVSTSILDDNETQLALNSPEIAKSYYGLAQAFTLAPDPFSCQDEDSQNKPTLVTNLSPCVEQESAAEVPEQDSATDNCAIYLISRIVKMDDDKRGHIDYESKVTNNPVFNKFRTNSEFFGLFFKNAIAAYLEKGNSLKNKGELKNALNWYKWAFAINRSESQEEPNIGEEIQIRIALGDIYTSLVEQPGLTDDKNEYRRKAIDEYSSAFNLDNDNLANQNKLAYAYLKFDELEEAKLAFSKILKRDKNNIKARIGIGEVFIKRKWYSEARYQLNKIINNADIPADSIPAIAYYDHALASTFIEPIEIKKILENLRTAIILDPTLLDTALIEPAFSSSFSEIENFLLANQAYVAGNAFSSAKDLAAAAEQYKRATELDPINASYHTTLGNLYLLMEKYDLASESYAAAVDLASDNASYHAALGNSYLLLEKYDLAAESHATAVELAGDNADYHYRLGDVYLRWGKYDQAILKFEEAKNLDDSKASYFAGLGEAYQLRGKQGDLEIARDEYENAIARNREFGDIYCKLAIVYNELGQIGLTRDNFKECEQKSENTKLIEQANPHPTEVEPTATPEAQ